MAGQPGATEQDGGRVIFGMHVPDGDAPEQAAEADERSDDAGDEESGLAARLSGSADGEESDDEGQTEPDEQDERSREQYSRRVQARIDRLTGQREEQSELRVQAEADRDAAREELAESRKVSGALEELYAEFPDRVAAMRFDHALAEVLDESIEDKTLTPQQRAAIKVVAELADRRMGKMERPERTQQEERPTKPAATPRGGAKGAEAAATEKQEPDWAATRLARQDVNALLEREHVRPEIRNLIRDAVVPKIIAGKGTADDAQIETWVAEFVKSQRWKADFVFVQGKARRDTPPTGGRRGVATSSAPDGGGKKPAQAQQRGGNKGADANANADNEPKTPQEADEQRRAKWRLLQRQHDASAADRR